jgi:hypothetical protein
VSPSLIRMNPPKDSKRLYGICPPVIQISQHLEPRQLPIARQSNATGGHVIAIQADVANPDAVARMVVRTHRKLRFAGDSPQEGDGFEPSAFHPTSSVSAGLAPSVAANLHPYSAPICTPISTVL